MCLKSDVKVVIWQVVDDTAKFNLHLKVKRGNKEEKFNVEVHKNSQGNYNLNQMGNIEPEFENKEWVLDFFVC